MSQYIHYLSSDVDDEAKEFILGALKEQECRLYFASMLAPSDYHWHFIQAIDALTASLYLPGVSSLLNGLEASIRVTICEKAGRDLNGDLGTTMSNGLLREASSHGLDISILAMPGEENFLEMVRLSKPSVRIVSLRNEICHGNFRTFMRNVDGTEYFTPECLIPVAHDLINLALNWAKHLNSFLVDTRANKSRACELPVPENPLRDMI